MKLKTDGNTAFKSNDHVMAITKYSEAIARDPTQATFYCNRAAVYLKTGDNRAAEEDCKKAIALDPSYAIAFSRLGCAYVRLRRIDEARRVYLEGIAACPDEHFLVDNLESLRETGDAGAQKP
jgi:Flp pilus assembly protein TadD